MAGSVLRLGVVVDVAIDGLAVAAVKSLGPPTFQNRKLQATPQTGLHAAGAAGLVGRAGKIDPHVAACHQLRRQRHVVIFQKCRAPGHTRFTL